MRYASTAGTRRCTLVVRAELQPWVQQWHGGYDAELGTNMAKFTADLLRDSALEVGCTLVWGYCGSMASGRS